ncbi:MAG: RNA-directed DNA polymerase [Muricomes sp.]
MSLEGIHTLKKQLENQTYSMSPYNEFKIYEPKERVIKSCSFKDKVVQHCLCDEIIYPRLSNVFIAENSAGQVGKGTLYGMDILKKQMQEFYDSHGTDGWILKCDITKFFYQIDHEILKGIVDYYFPDEYTKWLNHIFIDSSENPGLPLGNQVAQVYALLMLDCVDKMVTGELGIKYYGRYMDDFHLIHQDKTYLKFCLEHITRMVSSLKLSLNGKTQICPFKNGIAFLGFHHYMTSDGKYIRRLKSENKRRAKKKVKNMAKLVKNGKMSEKEFQQRYGAWKNHVSHGNCKKLVFSMDDMVRELMENQNNS